MRSTRCPYALTLTLITLSPTLICGCGGSDGLKTAPVSGQVTMDGTPLAGVQVTVEPVDEAGTDNPGTGSFGKTDEEGRYELRLMTSDEPGAVVGKHTVRIITPEPEEFADNDITEFVDPIPARYNSASTLTLDVPADGTDKADFELTKKDDAK